MNRSVSRARLALLPLALSALPVLAQVSLAPTVVTATRTASRADELVSDVAVIDRRQIEASTARSLTELLARQAGLQMSATGGRGKSSNVYLRGTEARHTILLVDGVRLGSATAGTPSWETIPLEMIERIEILRGPASALYGSEGVGGVVQVFTRRGRAGSHPHASLAVGSREHGLASAGVAGGQGALGYAVGVQRLRERGFSATNAGVRFGNHHPDADPFHQDSLTASLDYDLGGSWRADASLLHSEGTSWYDDGPGRDTRSALRGTAVQAGLRGQPLAGWQTTLRVGEGRDTNNTIEANFPGAFRTAQRQWSWQNDIETPLGLALAGLERREQQVDGSTAYAVRERTIDSGFVGLNGSAGRHSWQANLRRDRNSQFGDASTWYAGYGLRLAPAWRASVSHGTSFVAPSFNQLYFPGFGNPLLQPERGRNTDVALTWSQAGHEVKLVRFDNRIRGFMTNTTLPQNIPRARIDGWTLAYQGAFGALALRGSLDLLDPRNEVNNRLLPRRARETATLGLDWTRGAWRYGGQLLAVGSRYDDAANANRLGGFATLDLHADWQVAPDWSVQAKAINVADRQYETARGYNQPGRGVYLTLRWQPK